MVWGLNHLTIFSDIIFEALHTTYDEGTGLGLTILRDLLHEYSGTIEVADKNESNIGATFIISIPMINLEKMNVIALWIDDDLEYVENQAVNIHNLDSVFYEKNNKKINHISIIKCLDMDCAVDIINNQKKLML